MQVDVHDNKKFVIAWATYPIRDYGDCTPQNNLSSGSGSHLNSLCGLSKWAEIKIKGCIY